MQALRKDSTGLRFGQLFVLRTFRENNVTYCICQCDCGGVWQGRANCLQRGDTKSCGCLKQGPAHNRRTFVGERFGRLVVTHQEYRGTDKTRVKAVCACGELWEGAASNLVRGHTQSCGCMQREGASQTRRKDLTGQRFGHLVVLETTWKQGKRRAHCRCDCGGAWEGKTDPLIGGSTQSCGCILESYFAQIRKTPAHHRERKRLAQLKRRSRKLQLPITFTKAHLDFLWQYWKGCCSICGRSEGAFWHIIALDHWIPLSDPRCPGTIPTNVVPLCHATKGATTHLAEVCCNNSKYNKDPRLWLTEKLGARKAHVKLREIETYFALAQREAA